MRRSLLSCWVMLALVDPGGDFDYVREIAAFSCSSASPVLFLYLNWPQACMSLPMLWQISAMYILICRNLEKRYGAQKRVCIITKSFEYYKLNTRRSEGPLQFLHLSLPKPWLFQAYLSILLFLR